MNRRNRLCLSSVINFARSSMAQIRNQSSAWHSGFVSFCDQFFAHFLFFFKNFSKLLEIGECYGDIVLGQLGHFRLFPGYWQSIAKFHSCFVMGDSVSFFGDSDIVDNGESNECVS